MRRRIALAVLVALLVPQLELRAEDETVQAPAASRTVVPLTYATAKRRYSLPVQTLGFYMAFGRRVTMKVVAGGAEGQLTRGKTTLRFRATGLGGDQSQLKVDTTGAADWAEVSALAADRYLYRHRGSLCAVLDDVAPGRKLRIVVRSYPGRPPYASFHDDGVWSGTLKVGERTVAVHAYDRRADGDLTNDALLVDADGDGKLAKVEQVKIGETVLVGAHALTFAAPSDGKLAVDVGLREGATGRDLDAQLAVAPVDGKPMPAFEFTDQNGKQVSLASLKGKVLLINFWGAW